jgi:hypothetical protein
MMSAFTWICPECGEDNYCETDATIFVCGECGEEVERVVDDADISAKVEASSLGTPEARALRATVSDEHAARIVARARKLERCTCNGVVRAFGGYSSGCPMHDPKDPPGESATPPEVCSTCGGSFDSPPCSLNREIGLSSHARTGGVKAGDTTVLPPGEGRA